METCSYDTSTQCLLQGFTLKLAEILVNKNIDEILDPWFVKNKHLVIMFCYALCVNTSQTNMEMNSEMPALHVYILNYLNEQCSTYTRNNKLRASSYIILMSVVETFQRLEKQRHDSFMYIFDLVLTKNIKSHKRPGDVKLLPVVHEIMPYILPFLELFFRTL